MTAQSGTDSLGNFLGGLIFLVIATAIQVALLLPIKRGDVPNAASLVSGIGGGIAMALYVGRLQSKFINPRIRQLIALYSYTAIQPLFLYLAGDKSKAVILVNVALLLKCLLYLYIACGCYSPGGSCTTWCVCGARKDPQAGRPGA